MNTQGDKRKAKEISPEGNDEEALNALRLEAPHAVAGIDDGATTTTTDSKKDRLIKSWKFSDEALAGRFASNGVADALFALEAEHFTISEGDPLLIASVDLSSPDSVGFYSSGNYGIAPTTEGYLAGVGVVVGGVPAAAQQPPHALGTFISNQPGIVEKSAGRCIVFYARTLGILHAIPGQVKAQAQFRRVGPTVANVFGVGVEESLVEFYTLATMNSQPESYPNFVQTV